MLGKGGYIGWIKLYKKKVKSHNTVGINLNKCVFRESMSKAKLLYLGTFLELSTELYFILKPINFIVMI